MRKSKSTLNNSRASELGGILSNGTSGFTVRKRTGVSLFFHLFISACMVMLGTALLVYYRSAVGCVLVVALGISFGMVAQNLEQNRKMKEALEFMNALFSSAMGKGFTCCFIVKNTGEIVFYNRPFQALFPAYIAQDTRTLTKLMDLYTMPQADRDKLHSLMDLKQEGVLTTTIREAGAAEETTITFQLESIERPTGFFLIRGK